MPAEAESPALVRTEAEVEKRLLVRFVPFTALRERRVMPREVSIVLVGDDSKRQRYDYGEKVWDMGKSSETCGYWAFRLRNNSDDVQLRSDDEMDCLACQGCFKVCLLRQYTLSFQNWTLPCARNAEMYPAPC